MNPKFRKTIDPNLILKIKPNHKMANKMWLPKCKTVETNVIVGL